MSRLSRDYLLVGQYTEMIFPSYGVRFIAINNNVDSLYGDNDLLWDIVQDIRKHKKRGKEECTAHYIREIQLKTIVLDDLKRITHYARQKEKLFVEHITRKNTAETRQEIARIQREIDTP